MLARDRYEVGEEESKVRSGPVKSETLGWPQLHRIAAQYGVAQGRRL